MTSDDGRALITPHRSHFASLFCSCLALVLALWGLLEWDAPLTRFVRSLYHPVGYLPNPWLAQFSDIGDRLGRGESLIALSVVILAVGFSLKLPEWKIAGWLTLLAHGLAALISNLLKHVIGRPRPKFMHAGNLELSPGGGSGWDSFPSGHATASFAVAAVLALRFPKARWIIFSVAAAITASRVLRGAHFLTDTVGGAVIGYLTGSLVGNSWREWPSLLEPAMGRVASVSAALSGFVWVLSHQQSDLWPTREFIGTGMIVVIAGLVVHMLRSIRPGSGLMRVSMPFLRGMIGLGLGMTTGSLVVTASVLCACLAYWLRRHRVQAEATNDRAGRYLLAREAAFSLFVLFLLLASIELRGALPMV